MDDDPETRRSLQDLLAAVPDCEVSTASGFQQARQSARQGAWDIIITDEHMPDGRGSDLLTELSVERPGSHHVLMSGFSDFDMLLRGVNAAHIDHFLQKPYDPRHILDWVQRTLKDRSSWGAARPMRSGPFRRLGGSAGPLRTERQARAPGPLPWNARAAPAAPAAHAPVTAPGRAAPPAQAPARPAAPPPRAPPADARHAPAAPAHAAAPAAAPPAPVPAAAEPPRPAAPRHEPAQAIADALNRTANVGLQDIALLIRWASEAPRTDEKLRHIRMAMRRMEDTARNLEALAASQP